MNPGPVYTNCAGGGAGQGEQACDCVALVAKSRGRKCRGCAVKVDKSGTVVAGVWERKFPGYCFRKYKDEVKRAVAGQVLARMRQRIRELTQGIPWRSLPQIADDLRGYLPGWRAYFRLAQTPKAMCELDARLRHRLRAVQLRQWRRGTAVFRELKRAGASDNLAARIAGNAERWWRNSTTGLNLLLPIAYFDRLGVPRFS